MHLPLNPAADAAFSVGFFFQGGHSLLIFGDKFLTADAPAPLADDGQTNQIVVADLTSIDSSICRYFVICQGNSPQQVEAIAESVGDFAREKEGEKPVSVAVAIDHKAMLGNRDNYRMFANVVELDFPKNRSLEDLTRACTIARGQIMLQAQPENSLWTMKQRKITTAKLDSLPLDTKTALLAQASGKARWTATISYANSRSFGPLDPYIEALYLLAEPTVADVILEVSCIHPHFFLAVAQNFSSPAFLSVFLEELSSVGIEVQVMGSEPHRLCGIEAFH